MPRSFFFVDLKTVGTATILVSGPRLSDASCTRLNGGTIWSLAPELAAASVALLQVAHSAGALGSVAIRKGVLVDWALCRPREPERHSQDAISLIFGRRSWIWAVGIPKAKEFENGGMARGGCAVQALVLPRAGPLLCQMQSAISAFRNRHRHTRPIPSRRQSHTFVLGARQPDRLERPSPYSATMLFSRITALQRSISARRKDKAASGFLPSTG